MTYDHKDIIKAKYHGKTPQECAHMIESYLEFTRFNELIEERCNLETGRQYQSLEPFKDWWNDYISDEDDFIEEQPTPEPTFNDHHQERRSSMTYDELFIQMSGCFFCDTLPRNWKELNSADLQRWADENSYEQYDYWDASDIISEIESVTDTAWRCMYINSKESNRPLYRKCENGVGVWEMAASAEVFDTLSELRAEYPDAVLEGETA